MLAQMGPTQTAPTAPTIFCGEISHRGAWLPEDIIGPVFTNSMPKSPVKPVTRWQEMKMSKNWRPNGRNSPQADMAPEPQAVSRAERQHSRASLVACSARETCTALVRLACLFRVWPSFSLLTNNLLFVLGYVRVFANCSHTMCVMWFFAACIFHHSESSRIFWTKDFIQ